MLKIKSLVPNQVSSCSTLHVTCIREGPSYNYIYAYTGIRHDGGIHHRKTV